VPWTPPVLGRESTAAAAEPALGPVGDSAASGWRAAGGSTEHFWFRAASVTGVRHRLRGEPGDDTFAWAQQGGWLAVAVADGLGGVEGSADAAGRAARAAVGAAVHAAVEGSTEGSTEGVTVDQASAVASAEGPLDVEDLVDGVSPLAAGLAAADRAAAGGGATTIVLALAWRDGKYWIAKVGDSTSFLVEPGGSWTELFPVPEADRIGTETASLPASPPAVSGDAAEEGDGASGVVADRVAGRLHQGDILALVTDGVADPWRDGPTTVAPALTAGVLEAPSPVELAVLCDFSRQGCHDDRTLACIRLR